MSDPCRRGRDENFDYTAVDLSGRAYRALTNIANATRSDYEVLVVSPFRVERPNVVWIEETVRRGCAYAHDVAAKRATGDLITAFADDWTYADGWDETILPDFLERERKWAGKYLMGLRYDHLDLVGTVFGIYYANFPIMSRVNLKRYGWIGPDYKLGFWDADLSLRVWCKGGRCEFSSAKVVTSTPDNISRKTDVALCTAGDMALFISQWSPIYGRGMKTACLRDFNLDVIPEYFDSCMLERTIFNNTPSFLKVLKDHGITLTSIANENTPILIETVKAVNIVAFGRRFYCVPHSLGPIDLTAESHRLHSAISSFATLEQARQACC